MFNLDITRILISLPAIVIGLTFHEYAHGRMADYLGMTLLTIKAG